MGYKLGKHFFVETMDHKVMILCQLNTQKKYHLVSLAAALSMSSEDVRAMDFIFIFRRL